MAGLSSKLAWRFAREPLKAAEVVDRVEELSDGGLGPVGSGVSGSSGALHVWQVNHR
jgi:hypothetical protein